MGIVISLNKTGTEHSYISDLKGEKTKQILICSDVWNNFHFPEHKENHKKNISSSHML